MEEQDKPAEESKKAEPAEQKPKFSFKEFYDKRYKLLLIIPLVLLILAIVQISIQVATTGDFLNRGVSLKGGITVTAITDKEVSIGSLEDFLSSKFPVNDIHARNLKSSGQNIGIIVEADIDVNDKENTDSFVDAVRNFVGKAEEFSVEGIGSSLGSSFFKETFRAVIIAFIFMAIVVIIYFRTFVPSLAVVLCAFSDMIITLAIVNVIGMRISTAGIAAFLMLIGYSVDTDILLSTKVLKRKEGVLIERILGAMKTGLTMTVTTLTAVVIAMLLTQSEVIKQIMIILLIGLLVDILNTWIQNVAILRIYMERKHEP